MRTEPSVPSHRTHVVSARACRSRVLAVLLIVAAATAAARECYAGPASTRLAPVASVTKRASDGRGPRANDSRNSEERDGTPREKLASAGTHVLAASYYNTSGGGNSYLMLNNKGQNTLTVSVDLYTLSGQKYTADPVSVGAHSHEIITMSNLTSLAGSAFGEGSIQLSFVGEPLELGAQVQVVDGSQSYSFDEQFVEPALMFDSTRLDGLWAAPALDSTVRVVASNTSGSSRTITLTSKTTGAGTIPPVTATLAAHQTRVFDLRQELLGGQTFTTAGAVSITYTGTAGDIIARSMVHKAGIGYSASMDFYDTTGARSSSLHGAGIRIASVAGETMVGAVVARNLSTTNSTLTVKIPYRLNSGQTATYTFPNEVLAPGEVKTIVSGAALDPSIREQVAAAGVELTYSTNPGTVIASALTKSSSGTHVFRVPLVDPQSQKSSTGGYPWRNIVDPSTQVDSKTIFYLKNVTQDTHSFSLEVGFSGGAWTTGLQSVAPGQTFALDIRKLRDDQVMDPRGNIIPAAAKRGQLNWSIREVDALAFIGRAEQVDTSKGLSSSYACLNLCADSNVSGQITPADPVAGVGEPINFRAEETIRNSYGWSYFLPVTHSASGVTWEALIPGTNQPSPLVAIDDDGDAVGIGTGTAVVRATWTIHYYDSYYCNPGPGPGRYDCCYRIDEVVSAETTMTVQAPGIDILLNNVAVTDVISSVIVGQRILLTASVRGVAGNKFYQWNIPGTTVSNYDPKQNAAMPVPLLNTASPSVAFYWVDGPTLNREVTLTVTAGGQTYTRKTYFHLARPTISFATQTGQTGVYGGASNRILSFGDSSQAGTVGIRFNVTMQTPPGFMGDYQFVQVVAESVRTRTYATPVLGHVGERFAGDGADQYPYPPESKTSTAMSTSDSPGVDLYRSERGGGVAVVGASADDEFTMWVMFKPSGAKSIWVPLKKLDWYYLGQTVKTGSTWSQPMQNHSVNPSVGEFVYTETFPTWGLYIRSNKWQFWQ